MEIYKTIYMISESERHNEYSWSRRNIELKSMADIILLLINKSLILI